MSHLLVDIDPPWSIFAQGDRTLLVTLDAPVSVANGQRCGQAARALMKACLRGVVDIVPSFSSIAVHYQPRLFDSTTFKRLASDVAQVINAQDTQAPQDGSTVIDIPVCYGGEYGPDLAGVARHAGLTEEDVIRLHAGTPLYVFMLGFAPGAAYMGMLDERLDIGRRDTPRTALPKGAVAIANRQTIIYPNVSPGGWHVIGITPIELFFPRQQPPTRIAPGDMVRFQPMSVQAFEKVMGQADHMGESDDSGSVS
ncbi:MAG TPA: 5-oxoprolinase subunit PxpB [Burkholderiaceae bacterium]|nr:5-oxoprolinase subunit PxpB [Burkholderiaceae bacterium]